ncbi:MAG: hypothetical protein H6Q14_1361 [Bacteroidetes bacterium]|nr:hypothetical protein [Bacteroidota bacterium]
MGKFHKIYLAGDIVKPEEKLGINKILYNLIRFYVLFMPAYMLIVKLAAWPSITYWKEAAYIICFIFGFIYLIRDKYILMYICLILCTLFLEIFRVHPYFEYFTWLIMGLPLALYFKYIRVKDYNFDCFIIGIIIISALIWTQFFEKSGKYAYTFVSENAVYSYMRDSLVRLRYFFVSPMALSQYCWFGLLVIFTNQHLNKAFKFLCIASSFIVIFTCNTRAGVLLVIFSVCILIYSKLIKKTRTWHIIFISASLITILFVQIFVSIQKGKNANASESDMMRIAAISSGIENSAKNITFGIGGELFSTRSKKVMIFENSYLPFINSFGIIGVLLIAFFLYLFIFKTIDKKIILFSIPWFSYSFVFPAFQEITAVIISWFIIAMILNDQRVNKLLNCN